ncbi:apolipoprotein N-acyltransferase [Bradyrhizobium sp. i1.4.4]
MSPFQRFRQIALAIILTWGWKRALIAMGCGALSVLALAPFNVFPVLFITFPVLVWLIDGAGAGRYRGVPAAALTGYWFGLGYFVPGLYWIGYAFFVDADVFAWLTPFAVLGLPAYLSIFTAIGFALARLLWTKDATRILALAASLTIAEWLRGHALTGFPWNAFGYALSEPLPLAQTASLIGLWGMTFLSVAIFASPAALIDRTPDRRPAWRAPAAAIALLIVMSIFGAIRLSLHPTTMVAGAKLRLMQPDLQQDAKFNYAAKAEVMKKYLALSDRASGPQSTDRRARCHHPDLAGIRLSVLPDPRSRRDGADRRAAAEGYGADHGLGSRPRPAAGHADHARLQLDLRDRSRRQRAFGL